MTITEEPLVSAIIPTYNRAVFIADTIRSILNQTYKNIEIIVVDDSSTDNTRNIVLSIPDSRISYIFLDENRGPSAARNIGVIAAKGVFIAFLDSDDEWYPRKIALQLAAILKQSRPINTVSFTRVVVNRNNNTYLLPKRNKYGDEPIGDYVCGDSSFIHTSSIMLSRELALSTPFPIDQKIFEDWDFLLRLEEKDVDWLYLDEPLNTWNNELRKDRLSLSPNDGTIWLDKHRIYLSRKAQTAYSIKAIAQPLIQLRQRKLYAFKIILSGMMMREVTLKKFFKLTLKIFFPPTLLKKLKTFIRPPSRRHTGKLDD